MKRKLQNYIYLLGIGVIVYGFLYFTGFSRLGDSIISALFFIGAFYLFFSTDEKVEDPDLELTYPEVHYYHNSHMNRFGYAMVTSFVVAALLYFILIFIVGFDTAYVIAGLWIGLILSTQIILRRSNQELFDVLVVDYIHDNMGDIYKPEQLKAIVEEIQNQEQIHTSEDQKFEKLIQALDTKFPSLERDDLAIITNLFYEYKDAAELGSKLTSEEIATLQEESKENKRM